MRVSGDSIRLERLDSRAARRWAMATRAAFATHRAEIDDLNVFPVPDRDTGTNLYMTLDSALEAARPRQGRIQALSRRWQATPRHWPGPPCWPLAGTPASSSASWSGV